jgi:hypothetical protein
VADELKDRLKTDQAAGHLGKAVGQQAGGLAVALGQSRTRMVAVDDGVGQYLLVEDEQVENTDAPDRSSSLAPGAPGARVGALEVVLGLAD